MGVVFKQKPGATPVCTTGSSMYLMLFVIDELDPNAIIFQGPHFWRLNFVSVTCVPSLSHKVVHLFHLAGEGF